MLIHTSDTHCPHCETAVNTESTSCPNCGKLLVLDNLRFVRRIGSGGFGEVYEAVNVNLDDAKRAVKVIPITKYSPDEWKFLITYSQYCHFIPDIYDLKRPAKSENVYIIMEFIEGVSLEKTIPPQWNSDQVEVFLVQLLQHLDQMHNLPTPVIHRDIKPQNIKQHRTQYYLLDFGISMFEGHVPGPEKRFATKPYAPPEQLAGEKSNRRSDLFSLAVTACNLLLGQRPYEFVKNLKDEPLDTLRKMIPHISPALDVTLCRMLAKNMEFRPENAEEALQIFYKAREGKLKPSTGDQGISEEESEPLVDTGWLTTAKQTRLGHGRATGISWSTDGNLLAVSTPLGIFLYSKDLREVLRITTEQPTKSIAFIQPGDVVAAIVGQKAHMWHLNNRTIFAQWGNVTDAKATAVFTLDGQYLASASNQGVFVWRAGTDVPQVLPESPDAISGALAFSPTDTLLAVASDRVINVWQINESVLKKHSLQRREVNERVICLAFAKEVDYLAAATGHSVTVWKASNGKIIAPLPQFTSYISCIALSSDGKLVAVACEDGISLWSTDSQERVIQLEDQFVEITDMEFRPQHGNMSSAYMLAVIANGTVHVLQTNTQARTLSYHMGSVNSVAFAPDRSIIAAIGTSITLWRVSDGEMLYRLGEKIYHGNGLAFSPDGTLLASTSNTKVDLWHVSDGTHIRTFTGITARANTITFSADGLRLLTALADRIVIRYVKNNRVSEKKQIKFLKSDQVKIDQLGRTLAVLTENQITWQDIERSQSPQEIEIESDINNLALALDGSTLAAVSENYINLFYRGKNTSTILNQGAERIAFSPDRTTLALIKDKIIYIWRLGDTKPLYKLEGHLDIINDIVFAPGKPLLLASSSQDGTIRLWEIPE